MQKQSKRSPADYADIRHLERPRSQRPRMPMQDRAAQFSPFAALTGHKDAIDETARVTEARPQLSEDALALLDQNLQRLLAQKTPRVRLQYFVDDPHKDGGHYETITGCIRRYEAHSGTIILGRDHRIAIADIVAVEEDLSDS